MKIGSSSSVFVDLHHECALLTGRSVAERLAELAAQLPTVSIAAIGGFPVIQSGNELTWCDGPATHERIERHLTAALGWSAVLTYTNKSGKSLAELGEMCRGKNHLWGLRWLNATLVFARQPLAAQLAFARDTRFYLSWTVEEAEVTGQVFAATASLKEWGRYLARREDKSFDQATRAAMREAHLVLEAFLP